VEAAMLVEALKRKRDFSDLLGGVVRHTSKEYLAQLLVAPRREQLAKIASKAVDQ